MEPHQLAQIRRLFEGLADRLVLYARTWVDRETAADVVQEAFVRLMGQSRIDDPTGWLFRVVRNLAITDARAGKRRAKFTSGLAADPTRSSTGLFSPDPAAPLSAADAHAALSTLTPDQREIITLHLYCGLSFESAAAIAGLSTAGAFRTYRDALTQIRRHLEASRQIATPVAPTPPSTDRP